MSNQGKRLWFQLHLSTAVVLMFAAGGLIWINAEKREIDVDLGHEIWMRTHECGWPSVIWEGEGWSFIRPVGDYRFRPETWKANGLCWNIAVGLSLLFAIAVSCEILIRLRKKPRFENWHF